MLVPNQPIFRNNAVKHYMQSRQKDTLPRFISLPLALFLWMLLALLLVVGVLAWFEEIPTYVGGKGVILREGNYAGNTGNVGSQANESSNSTGATAAIFLPLNQAKKLHIGAPVRVDLNTSGPHMQSKIVEIDYGVSPYVALQRYGLDRHYMFLVTEPSVVVLVRLETISPITYAGSTLTAEVEVGSRRVISLLPGLGGLVGK